jgi:hypothetical protein
MLQKYCCLEFGVLRCMKSVIREIHGTTVTTLMVLNYCCLEFGVLRCMKSVTRELQSTSVTTLMLTAPVLLTISFRISQVS